MYGILPAGKQAVAEVAGGHTGQRADRRDIAELHQAEMGQTAGNGEEQRSEYAKRDIFVPLYRDLRRVDIGFGHGCVPLFLFSAFILPYQIWKSKDTMEQPDKKRMGAFCQAVYKMQYTRPSTRSARPPLILPA